MQNSQMYRNTFFIGMEKYGWPLKKEQQHVPSDQVWIFYENSGPIVAWGKKERPLDKLLKLGVFSTSSLCKLNEQAQDTVKLSLFEETGLEVDIIILITASLIDPLSYIAFIRNSQANVAGKDEVHKLANQLDLRLGQQIELELHMGLTSILSFINTNYISPLTVQTLTARGMEFNGNITPYLYKQSSFFYDIGMKAQINVQKVHLSLAYRQAFDDLRITLRDTINRLVNEMERLIPGQPDQLKLREQCYSSIAQGRILYPPHVPSTINTIITRYGLPDKNGYLSTSLFKDLLADEIVARNAIPASVPVYNVYPITQPPSSYTLSLLPTHRFEPPSPLDPNIAAPPSALPSPASVEDEQVRGLMPYGQIALPLTTGNNQPAIQTPEQHQSISNVADQHSQELPSVLQSEQSQQPITEKPVPPSTQLDKSTHLEFVSPTLETSSGTKNAFEFSLDLPQATLSQKALDLPQDTISHLAKKDLEIPEKPDHLSSSVQQAQTAVPDVALDLPPLPAPEQHKFPEPTVDTLLPGMSVSSASHNATKATPSPVVSLDLPQASTLAPSSLEVHTPPTVSLDLPQSATSATNQQTLDISHGTSVANVQLDLPSTADPQKDITRYPTRPLPPLELPKTPPPPPQLQQPKSHESNVHSPLLLLPPDDQQNPRSYISSFNTVQLNPFVPPGTQQVKKAHTPSPQRNVLPDLPQHQPLYREPEAAPAIFLSLRQQLERLYTAGNASGWKVTPSPNDIHENIYVDIGDTYKVIIGGISDSYPAKRPMVEAVYDTQRLPQNQVNNIVNPLINQGYDLYELVKAVVGYIIRQGVDYDKA